VALRAYAKTYVMGLVNTYHHHSPGSWIDLQSIHHKVISSDMMEHAILELIRMGKIMYCFNPEIGGDMYRLATPNIQILKTCRPRNDIDIGGVASALMS